MKAIVIYFSHAGENYSVGNIKEGNTKLVADMICEATSADRFEIVAEKSYDMAYTPLINLQRRSSRMANSLHSRAVLTISMITTPSSSEVLSGGEPIHR